MRLIDLPRTSSFRLAVLFLTLFGVASAILFGFLYSKTQDFLLAHVDQWLTREAPEPFGMPIAEIARRFDAHVANRTAMEHVFVLYDPLGHRIAGDALPMPTPLTAWDRPFDFRVPLGEGRTRYRGIAHRLPEGETVLLAQNMYETREFNEAFLKTALWGAALTLALGLLGASLVGASTVRRFDAVTIAIERIIRGDLSRRLPTHGTSGDLDRLAHVVNGMLDDIERLMDDVKGVCDDIAHDLRTPLTRMLAGLERARRRSASAAEYAEAIDGAVIEMRGILKTFSALLRIAEVEDGARRAGFARVNLHTIASDVIDFYEPLAEEKQVSLELSYKGDLPPTVQGDPSLLFEAIGNLLDNAIKFSPVNGTIGVDIERIDDRVVVSVADSGCGIGASEKDAVLRRFHRSEKSRHTQGNGLGLSLVAAVARLHDMTLTIRDATPGCRISLEARASIPETNERALVAD